MPQNRLFAHIDPILELRKHNTAISITPGKASHRSKGGSRGIFSETVAKKAERFDSRQRRETIDSVSAATRGNCVGRSLNDQAFSKNVNSSSRPEAKRFFYTPKTKPKLLAGAKLSETKPTAGTDFKDAGIIESSKKSATEATGRLKQQVDAWRSRLEFPEKLPKPIDSWSSSPRIASGIEAKYSISTIVKARSMAMKWRGKKARVEIRRNTIMPTITDDSTKISLCANVRCSPQFEAVIKLLEGEEDVDDTNNNFGLPSLVQR